MENSSPSDTQPIRTAPSADPGETLPIPVEEQPEDPEFAQTVPIPVGIVAAGLPEPGETTRLPTQVAEQPPALDATAPSVISEPPEAPPPAIQNAGPARRRTPIGLIVLVGILLLLVIGAVSAAAGYRSGIQQRKQAQSVLVAQSIDEQFQLGLKDMQEGRYDLARQRFEYVIQQNPNFPGVTDKLADVLVQINITATPTVVLTPTPSPTPDLRGVEELFSTARDHMLNREWNQAVDALLSLRKKDPNYQAVAVDGMLYMAFRNRGADKILKTCDLEGGIYDLSQAEQFGPLDADANSYITWASLYSTGASFWDLDWAQAVYYFAQVGPALPNLCDGSGLTAGERYRLALVGYGDSLVKAGDWCAATDQYTAALALGADTAVEESLNNAYNQCNPAETQPQQPQTTEAVVSPTVSSEVTPEETTPPPVETPTQEPPPSEPSPTPGS
jgi:tetratricopeptide (TPR) repeat protein